MMSRSTYNTAARAGYAAPCLLKKAEEGGTLMDRVEGKLHGLANGLITEGNAGQWAGAFRPIFAPAPTTEEGRYKDAPFAREPNPGTWSARAGQALAADYGVRNPNKPPLTTTSNPYSTPSASWAALASPKAAERHMAPTAAKQPIVFNSTEGEGQFFNMLGPDAKANFEEHISAAFPGATFEHAQAISSALGGRGLPMDYENMERLARKAMITAYAKNDKETINLLAPYVLANPELHAKTKKEIVDAARSKAVSGVKKAAPWVLGGIAALTPLASLLLSKKQTTPQATPQTSPQQVPARNPLSEAMYRRLGQSNQPVRLAQPTYRRMPL